MGGVIIILVVVVPLLFFFCYQRFQLLLLHFLHMHGRPLLPPRPLISYVYFLLVRFFADQCWATRQNCRELLCFRFIFLSLDLPCVSVRCSFSCCGCKNMQIAWKSGVLFANPSPSLPRHPISPTKFPLRYAGHDPLREGMPLTKWVPKMSMRNF